MNVTWLHIRKNSLCARATPPFLAHCCTIHFWQLDVSVVVKQGNFGVNGGGKGGMEELE